MSTQQPSEPRREETSHNAYGLFNEFFNGVMGNSTAFAPKPPAEERPIPLLRRGKKMRSRIHKRRSGMGQYQHKQERKRQINIDLVYEYRRRLREVKASPETLEKLRLEFDQKIEELTKVRDLSKHWVHVDLDMFFVAVEIRDRPELADKPVAVQNNRMIATANYVARQFGVRSAMPDFKAKDACPNLTILDADMPKYKAESEKFLSIVREYDPLFESKSSDEAKLEISGHLKKLELEPTKENIETVMQEIRSRICREMRITASCGYAANPALAKICSEKNKPDGQFYLPKSEDEILSFVDQQTVRSFNGIGPTKEFILNELGIYNGKQLRESLFDLFIVFARPKAGASTSDKTFSKYVQMSHGLDRVDHLEQQEKKSYSKSETPAVALNDETSKQDLVRKLCEDLSKSLREKTQVCTKVGLIVKFADYEAESKSSSFPKKPTDNSDVIAQIAIELLAKFDQNPARMIQVTVGKLKHKDAHNFEVKPETSVLPKRKPRSIRNLSKVENVSAEQTVTTPKDENPAPDASGVNQAKKSLKARKININPKIEEPSNMDRSGPLKEFFKDEKPNQPNEIEKPKNLSKSPKEDQPKVSPSTKIKKTAPGSTTKPKACTLERFWQPASMVVKSPEISPLETIAHPAELQHS